MKQVIVILSLFLYGSINAQTQNEIEIKNTIETFFEGFHKQDSLIMKPLMHKSLILQTVGKDRGVVVELSTTKGSDFLKSIVSIPKESTFQEKILSYNIQIDGNMANVWTNYEFWFNSKFSHCGVNSFQLIKQNNTWQIFYLVDTRRRENCKQ
ncbi:putative lumazine-binding protein [Lacinutrix venerupis]|uniref:nuclear transport factor 2 family protein n=1 Tax=Lacinutrix venerupis TaxID=1486034 RepID=UPI000EB33095|nr:nuclear transport factor 2 family protein [Lacinutrix venerupis]RLJ68832.1 putative lumazine-binding protein [Lacinutrix venerupis]